MFGNSITKVETEKDLGVIITSDLKSSAQCTASSKKANKILGLISRNITFKTKETVRKLYTSLVRPLIEYSTQFWSPQYQKDIIKLENIQKRATKLIPEIRNKPYKERLKILNLFSLEKRRKRGDMIQTFKFLNEIDKIDKDKLFTLDLNNVTRGYNLKLKGRRFHTDTGKPFYTNRIINDWNKLPKSDLNL